MTEKSTSSLKGHINFTIKQAVAETLQQASRGLDDMFKSEGHFFLIDEGPYADNQDYKIYLFACWTPVVLPSDQRRH